MKKFIFVLLIIAIPFIGFAQNNSFHKTITVTTDAVTSDTATVWQEFSGVRFTKDLSATRIYPSSDFGSLDNLTAYIYVDSVAAVKPTADSLMWKIERLDAVGVPIGNPVYVVLSTNSVTTTATWNSFTPSNRSATDTETYWVDLRGEFENFPGIKHSFIYRDEGVAATLSIKLHTMQMR